MSTSKSAETPCTFIGAEGMERGKLIRVIKLIGDFKGLNWLFFLQNFV